MTVGGGKGARAKYPRRGPAEDRIAILQLDDEEEEESQQAPKGHAEEETGCSSKRVTFASLPDKYEPLGCAGGEQAEGAAARKRKKRKRKLKKYGKVGKVLQKGCRYLVLGLQGLANAYTSPLGVAVSVAAAFR
ncbi:required for drug-induced death protein 1 isoform X2 [Hemicordylus capensis]|uniref:required for drug-induced death protein 1 isoform X2 n=1 Tax=Hemicordylus capensis TaxID=884348 RepID=UPI0023029959|nr:required for drug-induced death protein 1 isoform X2 [Hemicordylus capensis]